MRRSQFGGWVCRSSVGVCVVWWASLRRSHKKARGTLPLGGDDGAVERAAEPDGEVADVHAFLPEDMCI